LTTFSTEDEDAGWKKVRLSPLTKVWVASAKRVHDNTALSGAVTLIAELDTCVTDTPELVVRLVEAMLGNAHNGAGSVARGPATNAVNSNLLREKFEFDLLFMG